MQTTGRLIHGALGYDLLVWFLMGGREGRFRERVLDLARVRRGESVLDIGCGTGTLAIAAWRRVDPGAVHGVDPSPEMIARARKKARRAGASVDFRNAAAEALPWPDATFDVVLSTVMLHHLPAPARAQCATEVARVLKPGGRVLAVDFGRPQNRHGLMAHLHKHGGVALNDMIELFRGAGLDVAESGMVGVRELHYVLATRNPDRLIS